MVSRIRRIYVARVWTVVTQLQAGGLQFPLGEGVRRKTWLGSCGGLAWLTAVIAHGDGQIFTCAVDTVLPTGEGWMIIIVSCTNLSRCSAF